MRVRRLRTERDLSLRALARLTGYDLEWLTALEQGAVDPELGRLVHLANTLDITLERLLH